jgi:hypothetical protein
MAPFLSIPFEKRFITARMARSINDDLTKYKYGHNYINNVTKTTIVIDDVKERSVDLSDWRTWAHNRPGECKCGVPKNVCDYHRHT